MASILRKSLRNQLLSAARITSNLNRSTILSSKSTLTSPLPHHPSSSRLGQTPFFPQQGTVDPNLNVGFYPSFSFGLFLNPVSLNVSITSEEVDNVVAEESQMIWADSVKKKRKRKMNKHKLKKLRKRLRRKT